jgi:hypothetical protein
LLESKRAFVDGREVGALLTAHKDRIEDPVLVEHSIHYIEIQTFQGLNLAQKTPQECLLSRKIVICDVSEVLNILEIYAIQEVVID